MSLTNEGFDRPRLSEIKTDYDQRFTDALGPVNTEPDAVIGQIIGIFSAALDDVYEAIQDNYDSMYPPTAEGTSLDNAVSLVGLTRIDAAPTTVIAMCYGAQDTIIPTGALARALDNRQYTTTAATTISSTNAGDVEIDVMTVTNLANYQVIAGGVSVVYTADASATGAEIAAGLAALFDADNFLATASGSTLRLRAADQFSDFSVIVDSKLTISKLGTPVTFTGLEQGAYVLPVGALNVVDSSVLGWDEIYNLVAGDTGRFVESDEELRIRHALSVRVVGAATVPAIRARLLQDVDSVSSVAIYENRSHLFQGLMPPHSFETVISGGANQAIANKLFEVKPAGIETYGNTAVQVLDENGDLQIIKFSRPTSRYAWIRVSVNALYPEEQLPASVVTAIENAVLGYGNSLGVGEDIITQRFYGPIYLATSGIGSITVEAAVTASPLDTPVYSTANVSIARAEASVFDVLRVTVVGV